MDLGLIMNSQDSIGGGADAHGADFLQVPWMYPKAAVLKFESAVESPGGLVKLQITKLYSRVFASVGLDWDKKLAFLQVSRLY